MSSIKDRTGEKIGRLTIICRDKDFIGKNGAKRKMWKCKCDCGNVVSVRDDSLNGKHTLSCGCLHKERASEVGKKVGGRKTKEGVSREPLYNTWYLMIYRCNNPKSKAYHNYGERGIEVCEEWDNGLEGYKKFKEWALSNGYDGVNTLDRIDNNKGYAPDNCRWVTDAEQNRNKRNNKWITYNGETHIEADWERILGFKRGVLNRRFGIGWSVEEALSTPVGKRRTQKTVKNKICGDMGIAGIGAAQATVTGKVADSAKIGRNASTIAIITDKTPEEVEVDGAECGNKKLRVILNRNGMQHASGEYIDLQFNGNLISYEQAKQHIPAEPY